MVNASCLKAIPSALKSAIEACEIELASNQCKEMATEPGFFGNLRQCDLESICHDQFTEPSALVSACKNGFLEGTGEIFTKTFDSVSNWAEGVGSSVSKRNEFLRACDQSQQCKRSLIRDVPGMEALSDKELEKRSAASLYVDREQKLAYRESLMRRSGSSKSVIERASEAETRKIPHIQSSDSTQESRISPSLLFVTVKEWFENKKARLDCLDAATKIEMMCWGAAYIIDPTLVLGAALKGQRTAEFIYKLAKSQVAIKPVIAKTINADVRVFSEILKNHTIRESTAKGMSELIRMKNANLAQGKKLSFENLGNQIPGEQIGQRDLPKVEFQIFRKKIKSSLFPEDVPLDEVVAQIVQKFETNSSGAIQKVEGLVSREADQYVLSYKEAKYQFHVCRQSQGCPSHNGTVKQGDLTTIFPLCGKGVRRAVTLGEARKLIESDQKVSFDDFFKFSDCKQ